MADKYEPKKIEKKWQDYWLKNKIFKVKEDHAKPKYYCLEMFPYPSGRIHMGHVRNYAIGDVITRYKKMRGFNVLHPMGWDAFGMPAENAAIEKGVHPATWTRDNIAYMKGQLLKIGLGYDWDREVTTCDNDYYRWNQWIFLKMYKKGLAYKKISSVNWCPSCETVLANEQVEEGRCWRCDSPVTQKELEQWFFKITAYAEELLSYCDRLQGWPERVLLMQRNWIGKSVGAEVKFPIADSDEAITIFTTRLDTIYGATLMSIAPEHPIVEKLSREEGQGSRVKNFIEKVKGQNKIFRTAIDTEKEGVFTGSYAINPFTKEKIPIWLANFVLLEYGTGAVMAVPAHDQRDFEFAKKYNLPIRVVVQNLDKSLSEKSIETAYTEDGYLISSGQFGNLSSQEARERMADHIEREGLGRKAINYRLRDWGISRQRYWGTPIPIIYCDSCGTVPVSERDLPARLPEGVAFTGKGGSPLSDVKEFIKTTCPKCKGKARRETDTMDTFVDSSWYFLRYLSPRKKSAPFDKKNAAYWMPVDQYIGGIEHAVLHLLYARFFTKVLRDLGLASVDEPFNNLLTQGMVCKETLRCPEHGWLFPEEVKEGACLHCDKPVEIGRTEKMSKSKRNVVDPEALINTYGADTARLFSLFAAPPEKDLEWSEQGVEGSYRFLHRVWNLVTKYKDTIKEVKGATIDIASLSEEDRSLYRKIHLTIKKVTEDIERDFHFNTAIAALMELVNQVSQYDLSEEPENRKIQQVILKISLETVLLLLSPFAPHIAEELWCEIGNKPSIFQVSWPLYCTEAISTDNILIVIQINGKVRSRVFVPAASSMEDIKVAALQDKKIQELLAGKSIRKVVVVPGRLVNIVV